MALTAKAESVNQTLVAFACVHSNIDKLDLVNFLAISLDIGVVLMLLRLSSIKLLLLTFVLFDYSPCDGSNATSHRLLNKMPNESGVYVSINDFSAFVDLLQATLDIDAEQLESAWFAPSRLDDLPNRQQAREQDEASYRKLTELIEQFAEAKFHGQALVVFDPSSNSSYGPVFMLELDQSEDEVVELLGRLIEVVLPFENGQEIAIASKGQNWDIVDDIFVASTERETLARFSSLITADVKPSDSLVESRLYRRAMANLGRTKLSQATATIFATQKPSLQFVELLSRQLLGISVPDLPGVKEKFILDELQCIAATIYETECSGGEVNSVAPLAINAFAATSQPKRGVTSILKPLSSLELSAPIRGQRITSFFCASIDGEKFRQFAERVKSQKLKIHDEDLVHDYLNVPRICPALLKLPEQTSRFARVQVRKSEARNTRQPWKELDEWTCFQMPASISKELSTEILNSINPTNWVDLPRDMWQIENSSFNDTTFCLTPAASEWFEAKNESRRRQVEKSYREQVRQPSVEDDLKLLEISKEEWVQRAIGAFDQSVREENALRHILIDDWLILEPQTPAHIDDFRRPRNRSLLKQQVEGASVLIDALAKEQMFQGAPEFVGCTWSHTVYKAVRRAFPKRFKVWETAQSSNANARSFDANSGNHFESLLRVHDAVKLGLHSGNCVVLAGESYDDGIHFGIAIGRRNEPLNTD